MDLLLDDNKDISFENGDLVLGDSFQQETELILSSNQGEWKNEPLVGANMIELINSELNQLTLKNKIKSALAFDNKTLKSIDFNTNKIIVE